ncbi:MAG: hypothetical protein KKH06_02300 [Gammaproteobacteria bacterium]|nr:hypothetical protein [Gammaproteobacteria bacterium]MBU1628900.1 hypothetical protein [Gammaproteobacteria bacterium]MBU2545779.1 hypothetical protein [Gammaproteobacteria bacterium]
MPSSSYSPELFGPLAIPGQVLKHLPTTISCSMTETCNGTQRLIITFKKRANDVTALAEELTEMDIICSVTENGQLVVEDKSVLPFMKWLEKSSEALPFRANAKPSI